MGIIEGKVFRSGNSAAVRLPKELGFEAGTMVRIVKIGRSIEIRPVQDADADRRRLAEMIAARQVIGPVGEIEIREPFDFPERPGL